MTSFEKYLQDNGFVPYHDNGGNEVIGYKPLSTMTNCINTWVKGELRILIGLVGRPCKPSIIAPFFLTPQEFTRLTETHWGKIIE